MNINELKIGDLVYSYSSHILNRREFDGYTFFKITGETKNYWILGNGYYKARKSDLKKSGSVYNWEVYKPMNEEIMKLKKLQDEWRNNQ